jgi:hypothetical protein
MEMTKPATLAGIFALCALAAWLAVRVTFANLPLVPVGPIPILFALAIGEAFTGRYIRGRLTGRRPGKPLAPIAVARTVALAKASSLTGAALAGVVGGYLAYVLGQLDKTLPAREAKIGGVLFAAAVALVAGALYLERCCRAPKPPSDSEDEDEDYRDTWSWHQ